MVSIALGIKILPHSKKPGGWRRFEPHQYSASSTNLSSCNMALGLRNVRQLEQSRPIRWVGVVVLWNRAIAEFLPDALNLADPLLQPLQMLRRSGLPVAEGFARHRQERGAEERRLGDDRPP